MGCEKAEGEMMEVLAGSVGLLQVPVSESGVVGIFLAFFGPRERNGEEGGSRRLNWRRGRHAGFGTKVLTVKLAWAKGKDFGSSV